MYFIFHLLRGAGGESINEMPMQGSQAKRVNLGEIDARQVTLMHVFRRYYMYFKKKKTRRGSGDHETNHNYENVFIKHKSMQIRRCLCNHCTRLGVGITIY